MKRTTIVRVITLALGAALAAVALSACMSQTDTASEEQEANRQYMAQVNQAMADLSDKLEGFTDAVVRGDVVTMRTQADNALKVLDDLEALEAPEVLADIKAGYVDGCASLREALKAYVDLYTEIASASDDQSFDFSSYGTRLKEIQAAYDEGIAKLQETDALAAEL